MTSHRSSTPRIGSAWNSAVALVVAFGRAVRNRRHVAPLLDLNDRELRDLGLTRDDIRAAMAQPLLRDPSVVLMVRAVDRRSLTRIPVPRFGATRPVSELAG